MGKYNFGKDGPLFNDNKMVPAFGSVTTTTVPAEGSCAAQFVFKDSAGNALTEPVAGTFYLSEVETGLEVDVADTSVAVLTNGSVTLMDTGVASYYQFITDATGKLGVTITAAADDYYIVFIKPDGTLLISDVCVSEAAPST